MKVALVGLILLPSLGCNTVNDSVLNKEEMSQLKALPPRVVLSKLEPSDQIDAKKYIVKVMGSILLLEEEYSKDLCIDSDKFKECVKAARESLADAKKGLEKDANFNRAFSGRVPLNVVYTVELNRNGLLSMSSFKSEIEDGMSKEKAQELKERIEKRQQHEQETAAKKLAIDKAQVDALVPDFKEFIKALAHREPQ